MQCLGTHGVAVASILKTVLVLEFKVILFYTSFKYYYSFTLFSNSNFEQARSLQLEVYKRKYHNY